METATMNARLMWMWCGRRES